MMIEPCPSPTILKLECHPNLRNLLVFLYEVNIFLVRVYTSYGLHDLVVHILVGFLAEIDSVFIG